MIRADDAAVNAMREQIVHARVSGAVLAKFKRLVAARRPRTTVSALVAHLIEREVLAAEGRRKRRGGGAVEGVE